MKNINKLLYILFVFACACTSKKDYLDSLNTPPVVRFSNGLTVLTDSLKMSLKHGQTTYSTTVTASDQNENITSFSYELKAGAGKVTIEKVTNVANSDLLYKVTFQPTKIDYNVIDFIATDGFDTKSFGRLEVVGFLNIPPVASFTSSEVAIFDAREYEFDASTSVDPDQKFGGSIAEYKFSINGDEKVNDQPVVKYIFPKSGNYTVTLTVIDNDGAASNPVSKIITVN